MTEVRPVPTSNSSGFLDGIPGSGRPEVTGGRSVTGFPAFCAPHLLSPNVLLPAPAGAQESAISQPMETVPLVKS